MKDLAAIYLAVSLACVMFVMGVITGRSMDCPQCHEPEVEVCYLELPEQEEE